MVRRRPGFGEVTMGSEASVTGDAVSTLRLAVLDAEDLAVVSAHMQDAEVTLGDMAYLPKSKRFAIAAARFDWAAASATGRIERCQAGLHFERVLRAARIGFPAEDAGQTRRLLAMSFDPHDTPAGTVTLMFAGGARVRLDVECLEAEMRDLGPRWPVDEKPAPLLDLTAPNR